jgi:hypothetical protein
MKYGPPPKFSNKIQLINIKTQKQNCYKSVAVLVNNHDDEEYLDRYDHVQR